MPSFDGLYVRNIFLLGRDGSGTGSLSPGTGKRRGRRARVGDFILRCGRGPARAPGHVFSDPGATRYYAQWRFRSQEFPAYRSYP